MKKVTKAIVNPLVGLIGIMGKCLGILKKECGWDKQDTKQKWYIVWIVLSFVLIFIFADSWLVYPAIANFGWSSMTIAKKVNLTDEEV